MLLYNFRVILFIKYLLIIKKYIILLFTLTELFNSGVDVGNEFKVEFNRPCLPAPIQREPIPVSRSRINNKQNWDKSDLPLEWYMHQKSVQDQTYSQNWFQPSDENTASKQEYFEQEEKINEHFGKGEFQPRGNFGNPGINGGITEFGETGEGEDILDDSEFGYQGNLGYNFFSKQQEPRGFQGSQGFQGSRQFQGSQNSQCSEMFQGPDGFEGSARFNSTPGTARACRHLCSDKQNCAHKCCKVGIKVKIKLLRVST